jgi:cytochrome P450
MHAPNSTGEAKMLIQKRAVTALPHRAREDGYYKGMLIPKDSTIFIPTWAIHHSEDIFEDNEAFNPDRFLKYPKLASEYAGSANWEERDKFFRILHDSSANMSSVHHYGYGAGRRVCPGMHLAERNMWRIASKLLWAFDIAEPLDPVTGKVVSLDADAYNAGITQAPLPFKVRITPRSREHAASISKELSGALDFLSPFTSKE